MTYAQRLCAVAVLAFAFVLPAFAGDMHTGIAPPPPQGVMDCPVAPPDASGDESAADSAGAAALSLFQTVLSLF